NTKPSTARKSKRSSTTAISLIRLRLLADRQVKNRHQKNRPSKLSLPTSLHRSPVPSAAPRHDLSRSGRRGDLVIRFRDHELKLFCPSLLVRTSDQLGFR